MLCWLLANWDDPIHHLGYGDGSDVYNYVGTGTLGSAVSVPSIPKDVLAVTTFPIASSAQGLQGKPERSWMRQPLQGCFAEVLLSHGRTLSF